VPAAAFAPDGKTLATGSFDGTVKLWDCGTARERKTFRLPQGSVNAVAFSPDGKTLAAGTGAFRVPGEVVLWDVGSGAVQRILRGHPGQVSGLAFAPDGKILATSGSDKTVRVWDLASGKVLTILPGSGVAFSPDGKILATAGAGSAGAVRLWEVTKALRPRPVE
jgi:WD40 repeat protein